MRLLLHICCAPCLLAPAADLNRENIAFTGYFHNPNIHPFREFKKRLDTVRSAALDLNIPLLVDPDYGLRSFLRSVVFQEQNRCLLCYRLRLNKTIEVAQAHNFEAFSTTLLYSRHQNHELICRQAELVASSSSISFLYRDFRSGWQWGKDETLRRDLYRQSYCGCIYSEQERYDNRLKKQLKKGKIHHVQSRRTGNVQPT